jgi:L-threonylcarbamoyladenylate synthase
MGVRIEAINAERPESQILKRAAQLISEGKVLVCPTDTGYALSANALDLEAVGKIFDLKGRSFANPIHVAVSSMQQAGEYAHLNKTARCLAQNFLPGALTMVLPKRSVIPSTLVAGRDTVGVRIPDNKTILNLAAMTALPLTATSANISGRPTPYSLDEVIESLGETIENVAMVLNQGRLHPLELSTIIDLTVEPPQLLRQGRIIWSEISEALKNLDEE